MDNLLTTELAAVMEAFSMPKYGALPDMGLYLEQTTKYINRCFAPLGCLEITNSMIRNYVKMGLVKNPVQKRYYASHLAHLIAITVLKPVMTLDSIGRLFQMQKAVYTDQVAYDYFCLELENALNFRFGTTSELDEVGVTSSLEKEMLRSSIIAVSHIIYLNNCFRLIPADAVSARPWT